MCEARAIDPSGSPTRCSGTNAGIGSSRRRIEQFHSREFQASSVLKTHLAEQPLISRRITAQLRQGDANAIFFATLRKVKERLQFGHVPREGFPVLLVLSDINWRPLDGFCRWSMARRQRSLG